MVRKTLKTRNKKNNTYNKTKVYKSKAKKSQKRNKKNRKNSQKRKMKGGHSYTRRLLEMTTRGGYDNNEKEGKGGNKKKEGFLSPNEIELNVNKSIKKDTNQNMEQDVKKANLIKLLEKKMKMSQEDTIPQASMNLNSQLSSNDNTDFIKEQQMIKKLQEMAKEKVKKRARQQRRFGKKEGTQAIKEIQMFSKELEKKNLSDEEYKKQVDKFSKDKMDNILKNTVVEVV